jgi:hypothetical protein
MLSEILEEQKKINGSIEEMGARAAGGQKLLRGHVSALLKAADDQEKLAGRMQEIEKKIEQEAKVYAWVTRSVSEDMLGIRDLLRDQPPDVGPVTQGLAREVAARLLELLEAFKVELKRREAQPPGKQPPGGGGGGPPRLVPPLAELQMLRTIQTQVRASAEDLQSRFQEGQEPTPVQRMILERLAHRQGNLRDVLRRFIDALTGEGPQGSRR